MEHLEKEIWKDIPNYEGYYQVSNLGRVKSIPRKIRNNDGFFISKERILRQNSRDGKYLNLMLYKSNVYKTFRVHTLVAMAFLGYDNSKERKLVIDHIDNNGKNNHVSNLQITTQRINTAKDKNKKTSKFTGVTKTPQGTWRAFFDTKKKTVHLGVFSNENDAHQQYLKAVRYEHLFDNTKQFRSLLCELR